VKRFVVPPTWPSPPRRSWVPPKSWRPDPSWPPPPQGWRFWVDGKGNPVRGQFGRYGGPSRKVLYAGVGGLVFFLGVNIWAMSAVGLFGGDSGQPRAVRVVDDSSTTPSETLTPVVPPRTTLPTSVPPPAQMTTVTPTRKPTVAQTTDKKSEDRAEPTPTRSTTATKTVRPPRPTASTSPTSVDLLRLYCIQQGWDPEWCDSKNWPQDPPAEPRNEP
jgi:hypothetical protein